MPRVHVNCGRYGDIIAFLPALYNEYQETGIKPRLVVAKDYASVLDGVSYVEPLIFDGPFEDVASAIRFAKSFDDVVTTSQVVGVTEVIVSQVYGNSHGPAVVCDSFQKDAWKLANKLHLWPYQPSLMFDLRDEKREKKLTKGLPKDKPWIVVSTGGFSSPFPYRELLWEILNHCLPEFHIVDLEKIKAERIYDLLGIMDHNNTKGIICTDSAPLHLAYASKNPVHALVVDSPTMWHGTAWRPSYASYTRYQNFSRDFPRVLDLIRNPKPKPRHPNIVHVYQATPWATGDEKRRNALAAKTWDKIGWVDCGLDDNCFVRHAGNVIPDEKKNIPMIKDMLRMACIGRDEKDVIVLTNTDTCVASDFMERLAGNLPAYAYRSDFNRLDEEIPNDQIALGNKYSGCDLFIMRVAWWRRNHNLFPDMVLGRHSWDRIMRELFKVAGGREITNIIYHERHPSSWENPANINNDPSNLRNCKLAREWLQERKMPLMEIENLNYEGKFKKIKIKPV